jgi:hypothetical protein
MNYDIDGGVWAVQNPYPAARTNRGRGIPVNSAQPAIATLPNVRLWTFNIQGGQASRQSRSASPRFSGPVFVDTLHYSIFAQGRTTPLSEFMLFYQPTTYVTVTDSTDVTLPTGSSLLEHTRGGAPEDTQGSSQMSTVQDLQNAAAVNWKIGKVIQSGDVFLCVAIINKAAGAFAVYGAVRLLENVDAETIGALIGS